MWPHGLHEDPILALQLTENPKYLNENDTAPQSVLRDKRYYLETVTFQVEDEIYKVPRYHFEKGSEIHADAFKLPPTQTAEGQSDESPVKLDGIKSGDFERLLAALYPLNFNVTISMPKEHWISVLKLSTMWYMREVRELAIEHLDGYVRNTAEGIVLARMYHVAQWLRSGYQALARSPYLSLSPADTHLLGWETVATIYRTREEAAQKYLSNIAQGNRSGYYPANLNEMYSSADFEGAFSEELSRADSDAKEYSLRAK